jgi:quinol monooxygenase YgiN
MILIVVKFKVRPECVDDWAERVRAFTEATRGEPGNLWFEWSRSLERPNEVVLLEAFRDADAGAAHVGSAHFQAAMQELPTLIEEVPDIINVEVPGTTWSKLAEIAPEGGPA